MPFAARRPFLFVRRFGNFRARRLTSVRSGARLAARCSRLAAGGPYRATGGSLLGVCCLLRN
eukprot:8185016-Lingulodinium_polyedra.AAC.1